jgi:hypothetical protein
MVFSRFCPDFGEITLDSLTPDQILEFLDKITEGAKQQTKCIRYSHLSAFFNFIKINIPDGHFKMPHLWSGQNAPPPYECWVETPTRD